MNSVKLALILLAGGIGTRINRKISKQMIMFNNLTILELNIINFMKELKNVPIQIVTNNKDFLKVSEICNKYNLLSPVLGGDERHESTYNGINSIKYINPKYVLIHDTARPIISSKVIKSLVAYSNKEVFCVAPVLKIRDSIRKISKNIIKKTIQKNDKFLVQTPQLCNYKILKKTLENTKINFEDETALFLHNSMEVISIDGDPHSLKLTYEKDLELLEPHLTIYSNNYITKIGNGFDIHRFDNSRMSDNNFILLGGIKIKSSKQLIGHSDADVLLHAITDCILGVINKGDIGSIFPPSDNKWKNADSSIFLKHASKLLQNEQGIINNIDAIIVCEKPKIIDYSKEMKINIAKILNINEQKISIKGKTSESIGFIGREEGIAAMVSTAIQIKNTDF
jgi:2-C-methyl-D-erythritol 4-phosphate cytidylyltransferase/2-C-methyl-D-erythritol 2,4-cyclodiphosphate synthase